MRYSAPTLTAFDALIGKFDDEEMWSLGLLFLIRGAMSMHEKELTEEEGKKYFPDYNN